jgi:PAS domain S-box-containing protein
VSAGSNGKHRAFRYPQAGDGGVVITFVDITERHRVEERLEDHVEERTPALNDREQRLRTIFNSVPDAIVIAGKDGLIQAINPAGESIFGYAAGELIGHNIKLLMPSPYREKHDGYIARYLETGKARILGKRQEVSGCRHNGSRFPLELTITELSELGLFAGVIRDLTAKRRLEREVANASTLEQERIGREIHDGIGQQLTGLNILAVSLRNELTAAGFRDNRQLDEMIKQLNSLIGETRKLSCGLAPVSVGPRGLVGAIRKLADQVNESMGVACPFDDHHATVKFTEAMDATQIYRIVQEAVNNALKYAEASRITIELTTMDGFIELTVGDDGKGFDLEAVQESDGFGLRIMRYRTGIVGGQLVIDTAPGKGTWVRLRLPRQALYLPVGVR